MKTKAALVLIAWGILMAISMDANSKEISPKKIFDICAKRYKYNRCALVVAMAFVESRYNPRAFNEKEGARGLFQMKCAMARASGLKYSCDQLFDPVIAVRFCTKFLQMLDTNHFEDDKLVAAYNSSKPTRCKKFMRYSWGVCYPGEWINAEHVGKVMRHLNYIRGYKLMEWFEATVTFGEEK